MVILTASPLFGFIATEMGLKEEDIEKIRVSAQLHDVGKIGIEDRILKKPGALTPEEFEIMKTHTTKGAAILLLSKPCATCCQESNCTMNRWTGEVIRTDPKASRFP